MVDVHRILRVLRKDRKFLLQLSAIGMVPILALMHQALFDASYYMAFNSPPPTPIYAYSGPADGSGRLGEVLESVRPGTQFAWHTKFCVNSGVTAQGYRELTHINDSGVADQVVTEIVTPVDAARCGDSVVTMSVPLDARDGLYEVRRSVVSQGFKSRQWLISHLPAFLGSLIEVSRDYPAIPVRVATN